MTVKIDETLFDSTSNLVIKVPFSNQTGFLLVNSVNHADTYSSIRSMKFENLVHS